jgi:hypothetical protein
MALQDFIDSYSALLGAVGKALEMKTKISFTRQKFVSDQYITKFL